MPHKTAYVAYPGAASHAEIQAYLLTKLRRLRLDARLEVCVHLVGRHDGRIDLVVFEDRRAVFGIEIKKHKRDSKIKVAGGVIRRRNSKAKISRQIARYESTSMPIDLVFGMKGAKAYIENRQFLNHVNLESLDPGEVSWNI